MGICCHKSVCKQQYLINSKDGETNAISMMESFDKKKIPLRQVQTEERQRLRIKQFSKIPGEFCDISELFDVKKMYAKGKSTGGLIQVLLASPSPSPPSKGFINKKI